MSQELLDLIREAEYGQLHVSISPSDIFVGLAILGNNGNAYANLVLGRAQVGANCGEIAPLQLVPKLNYREGYTRLLRAAHGGEAGAWLELYRACSNYRSVLANQSAAIFFLEQAASEGVQTAKTILGAFTLLHAENLEALLAGQRWLSEAAMGGDVAADKVLSTFLVPYDSHEGDDGVRDLLSRAATSAELSLMLRVSQAFRLTRTEAARVSSFRATRRSLVIKPSRPNSSEFALPATSSDAMELLVELRQVAHDFSVGRAFERRRATELQSVLKSADIPEEAFFADSQADLGPYRSLGSWKRVNTPLLKSILHPAGVDKAAT